MTKKFARKFLNKGKWKMARIKETGIDGKEDERFLKTAKKCIKALS